MDGATSDGASLAILRFPIIIILLHHPSEPTNQTKPMLSLQAASKRLASASPSCNLLPAVIATTFHFSVCVCNLHPYYLDQIRLHNLILSIDIHPHHSINVHLGNKTWPTDTSLTGTRQIRPSQTIFPFFRFDIWTICPIGILLFLSFWSTYFDLEYYKHICWAMMRRSAVSISLGESSNFNWC